MITKCTAAMAILVAASLLPAVAQDSGTLDPHLEPLRPFLGKTWKGEFKESTPEAPKADVARWERALNGKAVRILHSVNDGAYGGESIITWDPEKQGLVFHYFTTAGFMTTGTVNLEHGKLVTLEKVKGNANGIQEVRGTTTIPKDGAYRVKTEYIKEGEVSPGRDMAYREDPSAKVVFK